METRHRAADIRIGALTLSGGDADGALTDLREALTLASALVVADAGDTDAQCNLADSDEEIAKALVVKGDELGALAAMGEAQTAREALVARAPGDAQLRRRARRHVRRAGRSARQGQALRRGDRRLPASRRGFLAKRAADAPKDFSAADGLAVAQDHLRAALRIAGDAEGRARGGAGRLSGAQGDRRAGAELRARRSAAFPSRRPAWASLSSRPTISPARSPPIARGSPPRKPRARSPIRRKIGRRTSPRRTNGSAWRSTDAKDADGALAAYREGAEALAAMPAGDPPDAAWRILLAGLDSHIGVLLKARNDLAGALAADRSAEALLTAAAAAGRDFGRGKPRRRQGSDRARPLCAERRGRRGGRESGGDPAAQGASRDRRQSDANLRALAADELGACIAKAAGGGSVCQDAVNNSRLAASHAPDDANAQFALHACLNALGAAEARAGDSAGAEATLRESLALATAGLAKAPSDTRWRFGVSLAAERLGVVQFAAKAYDDALASFVIARDAVAALVGVDKTNAAWTAALARSVGEIGLVANAELLAKNYAGALAALDKATPVAPDQNWLDLIRAACTDVPGPCRRGARALSETPRRDHLTAARAGSRRRRRASRCCAPTARPIR